MQDINYTEQKHKNIETE